MVYDPEGPVAKQFMPLLVNELSSTYNIPDDAHDTAEYINMMIGQNRSAADICKEVKDVVNIPIDEVFMGRVFTEIGRLEQLQNQAQPQFQEPQQPQTQPQQPQQSQQPEIQPAQIQQPQAQVQQPQAQFQPPQQEQQPLGQVPQTQNFTPQFNPFQAAAPEAEKPQFPTGPSSFKDKPKKDVHVNFSKGSNDFKRNTANTKPAKGGVGKGGKGGINKDYVSSKNGKKSFGMQNAANLQKALSLASGDSVNMQPFTPRPPKGRCPDFPYCKNRECQLAHPTKKCFAYPNCPNPPGTCDYLHPSEDGQLMEELEKTKNQYMERKNQKFAAPQVTLCKYGILCSKELCPFGHPTPANKDAKVIIPKWCRENKNCQNPNCEFAHSSPNYQAPPPVAAPQPPKFQGGYYGYKQSKPTSLEQCKFGLSCTNSACPKRHATSQVPCRSGYNCTRMDCTFHHAIDEDCRFGSECKNKVCFFRHPDGREKALFSSSNGTDQRAFALPEDQVMEQVTQ